MISMIPQATSGTTMSQRTHFLSGIAAAEQGKMSYTSRYMQQNLLFISHIFHFNTNLQMNNIRYKCLKTKSILETIWTQEG
jgi:hypothetical protein